MIRRRRYRRQRRSRRRRAIALAGLAGSHSHECEVLVYGYILGLGHEPLYSEAYQDVHMRAPGRLPVPSFAV